VIGVVFSICEANNSLFTNSFVYSNYHYTW
jgi:hypothetical protein